MATESNIKGYEALKAEYEELRLQADRRPKDMHPSSVAEAAWAMARDIQAAVDAGAKRIWDAGSQVRDGGGWTDIRPVREQTESLIGLLGQTLRLGLECEVRGYQYAIDRYQPGVQ